MFIIFPAPLKEKKLRVPIKKKFNSFFKTKNNIFLLQAEKVFLKGKINKKIKINEIKEVKAL